MEGTGQTSHAAPATHDVPQPNGNGASGQPGEEVRQLLFALKAMRDGDFSVRLPADWDGIAGSVSSLGPCGSRI